MTARDAFLWGREHLAASGSREAAVEAELLLRRATGWDRAGLYTHWESSLPDASWSAFRTLLDARAAGRPVHYILGVREFMGLSFRVDERVLIPRPETELLVEVVISFLQRPETRERGNAGTRERKDDSGADSRLTIHDSRGGVRSPKPEARQLVVDVGTGSGCIAVSIAHFLPEVRIVATDISAAALDVAGENARRHGVAGRISFLCGDVLDPLPGELAGRVDVIVSNPPYVTQTLAAVLPREIRDFEPAAALVGPGDGLGMHRALAAAAGRWLRPGGLLAMEVGAGQAAEVREFLQSAYADVDVRADYSGMDRVVSGRLDSPTQGTAETGANT